MKLRNLLLLLLTLSPLSQAFSATLLDPVKLNRYGILPANYSGLTPFGNGLYAVVSDKEPLDGFYVWEIQQDAHTGQIASLSNRGFLGQVPLDTHTNGVSLRDEEDIVYCPQRRSFFVSGEGYQDIVEMDPEGCRTGYELPIPDHLHRIYPNYGFEGLAYDSLRQEFYTMTENVLPADGLLTSPSYRVQGKLRLHVFAAEAAQGANHSVRFASAREYIYYLDAPQARQVGRENIHGVTALTALGDGRLAVLEREAYVSPSYNRSWVVNKIYLINLPDSATGETPLQKELVAEWKTQFTILHNDWANFEGMCLGQRLDDGRQTLLLLSDSQAGYGIGPFHLQDYMRVVVLPSM